VADAAGKRLDSWKEVATYLNRDVSTVRRWERHEGLPIHRQRHTTRDSVYADTGEIDAWLESRRRAESAPGSAPSDPEFGRATTPERTQPRRLSRTTIAVSIALSLGLVMLSGVVSFHDQSAASISRNRPHLTRNAAANRLYLTGRRQMESRTPADLAAAVDYFLQATVKDPEFALAYTGLADAHSLMSYYHFRPPREAYEDARTAVLHALKLDDTLAAAHTSLAGLLAHHEWNWGAADREYRRAIELDPDYAPARHWYANILSLMGRHEDAIAQARTAADLQPLSLILLCGGLGHAYAAAGRYAEAAEQYHSALEVDSGFAPARAGLASLYWRQGRLHEAVHEMEIAVELGQNRSWSVDLAALRAALGDPEPARTMLATVDEEPDAITPIAVATLYAHVGDAERALTVLERALDEGDPTLPGVNIDPGLGPLRGQPRFEAILRRLNLF
jgi:serine/threonine-protein kinase